MDVEFLFEYRFAKKGVSESFPFDEDTLVFKVLGKMFAATNLAEIPQRINLKCDPTYAVQLREFHEEIIPGYHMNKKHWNTVYLEGSLKRDLILALIDHSYDLVVDKLPKKLKHQLDGA